MYILAVEDFLVFHDFMFAAQQNLDKAFYRGSRRTDGSANSKGQIVRANAGHTSNGLPSITEEDLI